MCGGTEYQNKKNNAKKGNAQKAMFVCEDGTFFNTISLDMMCERGLARETVI